MKRTENTHRSTQQLARLRSVLLGETKAKYNLAPLHHLLRPSPLTELSPDTIRQFYLTAVPLDGPLDTPCLYWKGSTDKDGYGIFYVNGKRYLAHRLAYVLTQGEIPKGQKVMHSCDTPACIRWEHLQSGTQGENMRQKADRERAWNQHTPASAKVPTLPVLEYQEGEIVI
jgi:Autographiviridae HNH endonuclease